MNYRRHFQLKARVSASILGVIFSALALFVFSALAHLAGPGAGRNAAATIGCLAIVAAVTLVHLIIRDVRELEQLDRDDREQNPWRSRPRIHRTGDPTS